jgi:hypothetical protein
LLMVKTAITRISRPFARMGLTMTEAGPRV